MKIKMVILCCVLLTACNDAIPEWVNQSAVVNCGGADNVHQVFYDEARLTGSVTCKNGIYYSITLQEDK